MCKAHSKVTHIKQKKNIFTTSLRWGYGIHPTRFV